MTEGACVHFEFFARFILIIQACFFTHSPSVSHTLDSSLPEGAFLKHILRLSFVCFIIIGRAFFEPRDYRVVFFIQKLERSRRFFYGNLALFRLCLNEAAPYEIFICNIDLRLRNREFRYIILPLRNREYQ